MPELTAYLMNTGRVGGPETDGRSKKVRIPDSSAVVQAIVEGTVEWAIDPDFGYEVAVAVPGVDSELLQPRKLYEREGRIEEYEQLVADLQAERRDYLERFPALDPRIAAAL
jgi:phosphoenolpyruvate carboxykinase (ATP)